MLEHAHRVQAQLPYMDIKAVQEFERMQLQKKLEKGGLL